MVVLFYKFLSTFLLYSSQGSNPFVSFHPPWCPGDTRPPKPLPQYNYIFLTLNNCGQVRMSDLATWQLLQTLSNCGQVRMSDLATWQLFQTDFPKQFCHLMPTTATSPTTFHLMVLYSAAISGQHNMQCNNTGFYNNSPSPLPMDSNPYTGPHGHTRGFCCPPLLIKHTEIIMPDVSAI